MKYLACFLVSVIISLPFIAAVYALIDLHHSRIKRIREWAEIESQWKVFEAKHTHNTRWREFTKTLKPVNKNKEK